MDSRVERVLRRHDDLTAGRANFDNLWQQVAEMILPGEANFTTLAAKGEDRRARNLDGTGQAALRTYAAMLESLTVPSSSMWHRLKPKDETFSEDDEVKRALDQVTRMLFSVRYSPDSGFTGQIGSMFLGFGAFGTAPMYVEPHPITGLPQYKALPLASTWIAEDGHGKVDTCHIARKLTARQIKAMYVGRDDVIPGKVETAYRERPDTEYTIIQAIVPVSEHDGRHLERRGFRFASVHVCQETKTLMREGGFRVWPLPTARDVTVPGEVYGRSPAMWALPQLRLLNEMKRSVLRGAQRRADPPILLQEDGTLQAFSMRPGALNYGGIGAHGEELVKPLDMGGDVGLGVDVMTIEQELVNDSFYVRLFQILAENPRMTATEVLERAVEKGQLMGPVVTRQQTEQLGPMIELELDILASAGRLPELPAHFIDAGGEYEVSYESPIVRAQQAEEGVGIMRTFEAVSAMAQLNPGILDVFDWDGMARRLSEINGVAHKYHRPQDVIDQEREQRAELQQAAQVAEIAKPAASAMKDMASVGA